jgi:hypothetical protein
MEMQFLRPPGRLNMQPKPSTLKLKSWLRLFMQMNMGIGRAIFAVDNLNHQTGADYNRLKS